jgi:hypothetical protein
MYIIQGTGARVVSARTKKNALREASAMARTLKEGRVQVWLEGPAGKDAPVAEIRIGTESQDA